MKKNVAKLCSMFPQIIRQLTKGFLIGFVIPFLLVVSIVTVHDILGLTTLWKRLVFFVQPDTAISFEITYVEDHPCKLRENFPFDMKNIVFHVKNTGNYPLESGFTNTNIPELDKAIAAGSEFKWEFHTINNNCTQEVSRIKPGEEFDLILGSIYTNAPGGHTARTEIKLCLLDNQMLCKTQFVDFILDTPELDPGAIVDFSIENWTFQRNAVTDDIIVVLYLQNKGETPLTLGDFQATFLDLQNQPVDFRQGQVRNEALTWTNAPIHPEKTGNAFIVLGQIHHDEALVVLEVTMCGYQAYYFNTPCTTQTTEFVLHLPPENRLDFDASFIQLQFIESKKAYQLDFWITNTGESALLIKGLTVTHKESGEVLYEYIVTAQDLPRTRKLC